MFILPANILLHIPDGFLSLVIALVCWVITAIVAGGRRPQHAARRSASARCR